jgi:uncharacterized membrane protein
VYVAVVWAVIVRFDARQTEAHATREAPGRRGAHVLLLTASLVSLGDLGWVALHASHGDDGRRVAVAGLAVGSLVLSWFLVHTVYTLRYARYYHDSGGRGVTFAGGDAPAYADFAYLAFSVGVAYQVSDTKITSRSLRTMVLVHGLISFLFGSVILAAMVNLLVSLART